jgi:hypothetical protein
MAKPSLKNPRCINKSSMTEIYTTRIDGKDNFQLSYFAREQAQI